MRLMLATMNSAKKVFFTLLVFFLAFSIKAIASPVKINVPVDFLNLSPKARFLKDPSGRLTYNQVADPHRNLKWQLNKTEVINLGYTHAAYWFNVTLKNDSVDTCDRLMEIAYPVLDHIDLFLKSDLGKLTTYTLGDKRVFHLRPVKYRNFVVPITFEPNECYQVFFRVQTSSSMQVPLILWEEHAFLGHVQNHLLSLGLYCGAMIIMILYNFFVYLSVREINYLYYVLYVFCMTLFLASLNGISYQFLWPDSVWWNDQSIVICLAGVTLFAMLFARNFTNLPGNRPVLSGILIFCAVLAALIIISAMFIPYSIMIIIIIFTAVLAIILAIGAGVLRWIEGDSAARYFTFAWSSLMFGGIILAGNKLGLLPRNQFTENATLFGSALEVVLLSFALAVRLNTEKKIRYMAQETALQNERLARIAQAEALEQEKKARLAQARNMEIQQRANEMLELRVKERTVELEEANQKLELLSNTDGLTGVKNRRFFDMAYLHEYKRAMRSKKPLAAMIIDIDHFKQFNDNYGHITGDNCLKIVAQTIAKQLGREYDLLARYGGEEFSVLLPNASVEGALHMAEKIRSSIADYQFQVNGESVQITVSIGVAVETPDHAQNAHQMIANADDALYQSKVSGRNQITLHEHHLPLSQKVSMP